jgi:hypothetical protein
VPQRYIQTAAVEIGYGHMYFCAEAHPNVAIEAVAVLEYEQCDQARVQSNAIATFIALWTEPRPFFREPAQTDRESRLQR